MSKRNSDLPKRRRPAQSRGKPKPTSRAKPKAKSASARTRSTQARAARTISEAPSEIQAIAPAAEDEAWTFRNQLKRISLKDRPTQITLGAIALIIALIAAIAAWPKAATDTGNLTQAAGTGGNSTASTVTSNKGPTTSAKTAVTGPGNTTTGGKKVGEFAVNPEGNTTYAKLIGAKIKPQTFSFPGGNHNTWVGVTGSTIKAVFSYDQSNCGVNLINAISQAGANLPSSGRYYRKAPTDTNTANAETREAVDVIVGVFNKRGYEAFDQFPQIKAINDKLGGSPTTPFYGRKLIHEFIDGGSFQCSTRTTAAAVEIVTHRKPFVVFNNFDGAQYNMAQELHAKAKPNVRPMHFGTLWLADADYTRWAPYAWTQFNSGTKAADLYAQWLCARKVGQKAVDSPEQKDKVRKFALLYPNLTEATHVATALKGYVQQYCGTNIYAGEEFAYNPDPSQAASDGNTIAVHLKLDGVTTLSYLMDPIFPLFQIIAFEGQSYYPEVMWSPTGYYDSSTVQRLYDQKFMDKRSSGITQFGVPGGWGFTAGDPFYAYHDSHLTSPHDGKACDPNSDAGMDHDSQYCKAPSAIVTWYYTTLATLGGIVFAGPDLNPTSLSHGLQSYPAVRFGGAGPTDKPHPAQLGSGPGHYYFIVDATEYQWRAGYISPPPEQKTGFIEYPDCERHYLGWKPERLASGWEKGGANYNAFCGNAAYANFGSTKYQPGPRDINSQGNQKKCTDTPSKTCEKDNYPDWQAW